MHWRTRWAIPGIAFLLALIIRTWRLITRMKMASADGRQHPADPAVTPFMYLFWHEGLLAPLTLQTRIRVLISQHTDGELIAQVCQRVGMDTVRGSPTLGARQALLEMIRGANDPRHFAITPDGPRGPRRRLKPGAILVASKTGLPIVPIGVGFTSAWRFDSWDRFALPLPASTMLMVYGEPIHVPAELSRRDLVEWVKHVEARLEELSDHADDWAKRLRENRRAETPVIPTRQDLRRSA